MRLKIGKKLSLWISLIAVTTGGVGCSLTATRPVQEMSNAEVALKAAKDLNADSLVPDVYRKAVDGYFKAKREYRLKNFEKARALALGATRLAEQAEFEAYRLGGATPEAGAKMPNVEGGLPDAESAFRETGDHAPPPSGSAPGGAPGPAILIAQAGPNQFKVTVPNDIPAPTTGGNLPVTGGAPPLATQTGQEAIKIQNFDARRFEKPTKAFSELPTMSSQAVPDLYGKDSKNNNAMPEMGTAGIKESNTGLDAMGSEALPSLSTQGGLGENAPEPEEEQAKGTDKKEGNTP